jgi:hypothetical protein
LSGPVFGFSDAGSLPSTPARPSSPSLIVFLIQKSQNRDTKRCRSGRGLLHGKSRVRVELVPGQMLNTAAGANRNMPPVTTPIGVIGVGDFRGSVTRGL